MKRAKITFFMIAYNEQNTVMRAVKSVLKQTERDVEIYVRNNGSADATGEVVRAIADNDGRVHLVENKLNWMKDEGVPFTNEHGAIDIWPIDRDTLGDYVAFLDADDELEPEFAAELLKAAEKNDAQITICGNAFCIGGVHRENDPVRMPPDMALNSASEWTSALRDTDTFVALYNVFRTWWSKLFRRDFFLEHYNEAWQREGGKYGPWIDTVIMLRYLKHCERLSCVAKPLYLFTVGAGSTYANFKSSDSVLRARQAEKLFDEGLAFLKKKDILTQPNYRFLYALNWAFCWENIEGLQRVEKTDIEDMDRIIVMLNNRVAEAYLPDCSEEIYSKLEYIFNVVWTKSGYNMKLYMRYPIRLLYAKKLLQACPESELLPAIVLGILCDPENRNLLGRDMLGEIAEHHPALKRSLEYDYILEKTLRHDSLRNWWAERIKLICSEDKNAEALSRQLKEAFAQEEYEKAVELMGELSRSCPLDRNAIYFRIVFADMIREHELAMVMAASARVLFGSDAEMQQLCWQIIAAESDTNADR